MPTAFATVTVRVECKSNWSPETTVAQISKQATEDALGQLRHAFEKRTDMKLVGTPEITMVHADLSNQQ